jgi:hypothetical protein
MFPAVNAVYRRYFPEARQRAFLSMFQLGTAGLILKWIVLTLFYKNIHSLPALW